MICLKDRSFFNSSKNRKRATLYFFFFPDYKALGILKRQFPNASLIGLTATATSHVLKDAQKILCVEKCFTFTASFNRPNLYYEVCNSMSVYFVKDFSREFQFSSVAQSCLTLCNPMQHARPPCPSPTPGAYTNSCPLSLWCHPTISSSVVPFSSCPQSFPASESFQSLLFHYVWVHESCCWCC